MRKIVLTLMIVAFLACPAMAQRYRQMQLTIVDEFGDPVTNIDEIEIYDAGTSDTSTIYPRRDGGTMTNPITTDSTASTFSQSLGQVTWFLQSYHYRGRGFTVLDDRQYDKYRHPVSLVCKLYRRSGHITGHG